MYKNILKMLITYYYPYEIIIVIIKILIFTHSHIIINIMLWFLLL